MKCLCNENLTVEIRKCDLLYYCENDSCLFEPIYLYDFDKKIKGQIFVGIHNKECYGFFYNYPKRFLYEKDILIDFNLLLRLLSLKSLKEIKAIYDTYSLFI